jgi:hypothetical protein
MPALPNAVGQIVAAPPDTRPRESEPASVRSRAAPRIPRSPAVRAVLACAALAALSAALLPTVPSYDPFSWVVWGREVTDPHLSFATGGGPSWKPLPVLFTAVWGLFGGAAPTLWVITARAFGLLAVVGAWRLGTRLGGRFAGLFAALGVVTTQDFAYYMFRGASEPILIASVLWWIDRHLEGKRSQAYVLAVAASLIRPEAWPFLGLYGLWLWRREPRLRLLVIAGWASIPLLWFVPPWIGSGQPFLAASHAKQYNGHLGSSPVITALKRAADLQVLPVLIAAAAGVALAWRKERDKVVAGLVVAAVAWVVLVVAMVLDGYPGLERFFLGAAAVICVLGGVGVARVALLAGGGARTLAVAAILIGVSIPLSWTRIRQETSQRRIASHAVTLIDQLAGAARAVGGHNGVFPCRSSIASVNHSVQTALAWKLQVTLGRVHTRLEKPGLLFVGPHNSIDGGLPRVTFEPRVRTLVASVGAWRVYRVTKPGASAACVGG